MRNIRHGMSLICIFLPIFYFNLIFMHDRFFRSLNYFFMLDANSIEFHRGLPNLRKNPHDRK